MLSSIPVETGRTRFGEMWIVCPCCGSENLHQGGVEVHQRKEDAESGVHVKAAPRRDMPEVDRSMARAIGRRDSLRIDFWCEECPARPELQIVQHKGVTYLQWTEKEGP